MSRQYRISGPPQGITARIVLVALHKGRGRGPANLHTAPPVPRSRGIPALRTPPLVRGPGGGLPPHLPQRDARLSIPRIRARVAEPEPRGGEPTRHAEAPLPDRRAAPGVAGAGARVQRRVRGKLPRPGRAPEPGGRGDRGGAAVPAHA